MTFINSNDILIKQLEEKINNLNANKFNKWAASLPYPAGQMRVLPKNKYGKILYYPLCEKSEALREIIWLHNFRTTLSSDTLPFLSRLGFEVIIEKE